MAKISCLLFVPFFGALKTATITVTPLVSYLYTLGLTHCVFPVNSKRQLYIKNLMDVAWTFQKQNLILEEKKKEEAF